ncbi:MAG: ATP-binding cassette domain-containing protein [Clostridia bacterium]|nr:ATP-binding cassette domain-containing protein [Clostridia bacterium]
MLELRDISKVYSPGSVNEHILFRHFNLTVADGQFISVVGSNGSGKTSLLNLICGSIPVDEGSVVVNGKDITRVREHKRYRTIGRVYQNPAMGTCGTMTLLENMAMADNKNRPYNITPGINRRRVQEYREMLRQLGLGLEDKLGVPVASLSGGQRQALSLLMTTLTPIEFLILDEHTAALDPKTAEIIMQLTGRIVAEKKLTTLMVTHNLRYALEYGDRLLMMHEGRIVMDHAGAEKQALQLEDILGKFNEISIECGN